MHIIAVCPFCQTSYQLQPELRGKSIVCPNGSCRKIFMIAPHPPSAPPPPPKPPTAPPGNGSQQSGSVGEMVPILPAESAAPAAPKPAEGDWWQGPPVRQPPSRPLAQPPHAPTPPPVDPVTSAPSQTPWWGDAPPPVRAPQVRPEPQPEPPAQPTPKRRDRSPAAIATTPSKPAKASASTPTAQTQPMPPLEQERSDQPRELPPGMWEPPPVRRGAEATSEPEAEAAPMETHRPIVSKRRARWLIAAMILIPLAIVGGVGGLVWGIVHKSEEERFAAAKGEYEQGHYGSAVSKLDELVKKFPESVHAPEYRFLKEWAALCGNVADPGENLAGAVEKLDGFLKSHKKDPFMEQYGRDAGPLLLRLTKMFAESNGTPTGEEPLAAIGRIEQLRRTVEASGPDVLTKEDGAKIEGDLGKVRQAVQRWRERREVLTHLKPRPKESPFDAIKRAESLLKWKEREVAGLGADPEVRAALERLYDAHRASVVYHPYAEKEKREGSTRLDDDVRSRAFDPLLPSAAPGKAAENDPIVLALARGVLYALKQSNGELVWFRRVGIDTTVLPLRVPARLGRPELLLVLSADTRTLTAYDVRGEPLWEYSIGQAVLGKPVIIDQRAYLAAYDGWVHEIELSQGKPLGRYYLGQRLTRGGTREGLSKRIYFPADDSCIYVLDVDPKQQQCVLIHYDGHPAGSLRSAPIVIPPERREAAAGDVIEADETPGFLILNQANGLDSMSLRVFQLPLQDRHAAPLTLKSPARLNGWTWFEPYQDGEKMVAITDAGIMGIFGIRQVGNRDPALFPWLHPGGLNVSPFLHGGDAPRERGRAQVVHVEDNVMWVLAHGRLQQLELLWKNTEGPKAVADWENTPLLGSPLHAPQRIEDSNTRHSTFILVTQPLNQQTCIASAVNDEGKILWQRQLGLVFQGEPLTLKPPAPRDDAPMLLALDRGGGLYAFDPKQSDGARALWKSVAPAFKEANPQISPRLLPAPDGRSAYEIAVSGDGKQLIVRHVEWQEDKRGFRFDDQEISLLSQGGAKPLQLAGAPSLVGSQLVVPMSEGDLWRVMLGQENQLRGGPNWRSRVAASTARGYVLGLGGDRFLTSNGSNGLAVWEWPSEASFRKLPLDRGETTLQLSDAIAAPPVLLPTKGDLPPRVLVADSGGFLHLLSMAKDGSLQDTRKWEYDGKLTATPFLFELPGGGLRVGCLLDERRLVWLDPEREKILWTYRADGAAIVGQPRLVEGNLIVALQSGRYLALDPATGETKGPGYTLRASAAPAASPVGCGAGRMLAPLSDGTAMLLPLKLLLTKKK